MEYNRIQKALEDNDRRGEKAIALIQAMFASVILALHLFSAFRNNWETFSGITLVIVLLMLMSCALRAHFSNAKTLKNRHLHGLTVLDGLLLLMLMVSYGYAYNLPFETVFKTPSSIFLLVYTCIRVVRLDVWAIITAAVTVVFGWLALLTTSAIAGIKFTTSYIEYVNTTMPMLGANFELALGYGAIVIVLCLVAKYARQLITSSAHAEDLAEAIATSENNLSRLQSIIRSTSDGVLILDVNGTIEQVNPALLQMFDYSQSDLEGKNVRTLMDKEHGDQLLSELAVFLRDGQSQLIGRPFEAIGVMKNKEETPVEVSITEFNSEGDTRFAGFVRDISDRKKAQDQEKNALAQFEDAVQSALDAIIIIDARDRILSFNPAAEEIFGYQSDEVLGKKMGNLIIPEKYREAHFAGMKHFLKTGEGPVLNNRIEIEGMRKSGEEFELELAIRNIESPLGQIFIGYARDITSRKAAEKELLEAKESAEVANEAKASFPAMMSHEIRTPLNGVLGILDLLKATKLSKEQKEHIDIANQSGLALMTIINDILDFSKMDAGKLEIEHRTFEVDNLISSVTNLIKASAYEKNVELISYVDSNVPKVLIGDNHRIGQVIINLLSNAIKFTNAGKVELTTRNVGSELKPRIRINVKDTGLGIPEEKHDQLFAEFATLDNEYSAKFGGTGLGLSISKALVEAMDGEIGFTSDYGFGSDFWFELPLDLGSESDIELTAENVLQSSQSAAKPLKILVAEDNETNQMVISVILKRLGCDTDIVSNGEDAVSAAKDKRYDLIFMDVSMPKMDGLEAAKHIRQLPAPNGEVKIIALTAYTQDEDKVRALDAGMDDFLSKPVFRDDIINAINNSLSSSITIETEETERSSSEVEFDDEALADIVDGMDEEDIKQLFMAFGRDLERHLGNAEIADKDQNLELLERASHGLKGPSGVFGATELHRLSTLINDKCLKGKHDPANVTALISECQAVIAFVKSKYDIDSFADKSEMEQE